MRRANLGEFLVLQLHDSRGGVSVLMIPKWIDRHHLHVDRQGVHIFDALVDIE